MRLAATQPNYYPTSEPGKIFLEAPLWIYINRRTLPEETYIKHLEAIDEIGKSLKSSHGELVHTIKRIIPDFDLSSSED